MARPQGCGRCSTRLIPERTLVAAFTVHAPTLDDVFLALTQKDTAQKETVHV